MKDLGEVLAAIVPLAIAINWLVGLLKGITNLDKNDIVTRVTAFVGSFIVISLYAHGSLDVGGSLPTVSALPWQGLAFASLFIASTGGTLADTFKTFNRSDTSVAKKLIP